MTTRMVCIVCRGEAVRCIGIHTTFHSELITTLYAAKGTTDSGGEATMKRHAEAMHILSEIEMKFAKMRDR